MCWATIADGKTAASDNCKTTLAIVRACYTMENGPNDKTGEKIGNKKLENLLRSKMENKMAEKYRKMENRANFLFRHLSAIFSPFLIGASTIFPFFPLFVVRPVFHCVAGPHDFKTTLGRKERKTAITQPEPAVGWLLIRSGGSIKSARDVPVMSTILLSPK